MKNEKAIIRRCDNCVFQGTFRDMGASCGVCTLEDDFLKAVSRYNENEKCGCNEFFTKDMIPLLKAENEKLRIDNRKIRETILKISGTKYCKRCQYKIRNILKFLFSE